MTLFCIIHSVVDRIMKCMIILSVCVVAAMSALLPEHHMTAQDMCGSLPDLNFLSKSYMIRV